jgi:endonuclease III
MRLGWLTTDDQGRAGFRCLAFWDSLRLEIPNVRSGRKQRTSSDSKVAAEILNLRRKAAKVSQALHRIYGSPNHNNKSDPLDELVFIILSQMTTHQSFERVFNRLKDFLPSWDAVCSLPLSKLKRLIKDAGLSNLKAPRIRRILQQLRSDFGCVTLEPLRGMSTSRAEDYLTGLPGVKKKTAKCVLMYSLHRQVLPVDTHVLRVARRLGLVSHRHIGDAVHAELEQVVALRDRYGFHVNTLAHGRAVCRATNPRCNLCALRSMCDYYRTQSLS